jgi:hypothetical protein
MTQPKQKDIETRGITQLNLVEHALCPLVGLQAGQIHESEFHYSTNRQRQTAHVKVIAPLGLKPSDEFYLWGLLALTFAQQDATTEFIASPYYCLKELGLPWGGKQARLFDEACGRLALVSYQGQNLYDPIRKERVRTEFGFFDRIRPMADDSQRAWRFHWSPVFFEFCKASGGQLMFDLELYRDLDHASRRLFLLLQKQFYRSQFSQWFDVRQLASQQLGFDESQPLKNLKQKLFGCIRKLQQCGVLSVSGEPSELVEKIEKGRYRIRFERGQRFSNTKLSRWNAVLPAHRQAVASQLHRIGLEDKTIGWVFRSYKPKAITEWAEITIARMERKLGFAKTPAAFLMHHLKEASAGKLTPPDWWLNLKKEEFLKAAHQDRKSDQQRGEQTNVDDERKFREWLKADGQSVFAEAVQETVDELGETADRRQIAELAQLKAKRHFRRIKISEAKSSQTT